MSKGAEEQAEAYADESGFTFLGEDATKDDPWTVSYLSFKNGYTQAKIDILEEYEAKLKRGAPLSLMAAWPEIKKICKGEK